MTETDALPPSQPSSKLKAKRWNERVRFAAAALDRCGTVVLAGAVLAPLLQNNGRGWSPLLWSPAVLMLHLVGQFALGRIREEA